MNLILRRSRLLAAVMILLTACGSAGQQTISTVTPVGISSPAPVESPTIAPSPTLLPTPAATLIPYNTPAWFGDTLLYEIFVRSFRDADGDGIGDLQGISDSLDYIQSLGANAIWLMPIYPSPSEHGYDVTDYLAINPDYGTLDDFRTLVQAVHARDMRLILDFVPSHLSNQHPIFQDAYKNPASAYSDWFVWNNESHTTYAGFAGNESMPRFNHYNPEVVQFLAEAARFWMDPDGDGDTMDGVDGFRVDNATFPPQEFLVALRQAVKSANPQSLLLGETWVHNPQDLARFFPEQFDALFDFPLYELLQGSQDSNGDGLLAGKGFPVLLTTLLKEEAKANPAESMVVRFINNHDTNRTATELGGDPARLRLAPALLAALPGPVMVYYGEEIGMFGQKGGPPAWDNYRREPMDWYAGEAGPGQATWFHPEDGWNRPADGVSVEEQSEDPAALLNLYRLVFSLRRAQPALAGGDFSILDLNVSGPGPWGFVRSAADQTIVAVYNFAYDEREIGIPNFPFSGSAVIDLLSGEALPGAAAGEVYSITLPSASAVWLEMEK